MYDHPHLVRLPAHQPSFHHIIRIKSSLWICVLGREFEAQAKIFPTASTYTGRLLNIPAGVPAPTVDGTSCPRQNLQPLRCRLGGIKVWNFHDTMRGIYEFSSKGKFLRWHILKIFLFSKVTNAPLPRTATLLSHLHLRSSNKKKKPNRVSTHHLCTHEKCLSAKEKAGKVVLNWSERGKASRTVKVSKSFRFSGCSRLRTKLSVPY